MDPAEGEPERLVRAVSSQGALLGQHEQLLRVLIESQQSTTNQIAQINVMMKEFTTGLARVFVPAQSTTAAPPPMPPSSVREAHVPDPDHYSGDMGKCGGFLLQCSLVFSQKPITYATDSSKIAFIMGLLKGKALDWATATWQNNLSIRNNFDTFESELKKVFDHPVQGKEAAKRLLSIHQGTRSVAEFSVEFRTLAAEAGWDNVALQSVFVNGLSEQLKDELALKDDEDNLDSLISTAIKIDNRLRERRRERANRPSPVQRNAPPRNTASFPVPAPAPSSPGHTSFSAPEDEPMQLGRAKLTPTERLRRIKAGECIYCGQFGHFLASCPSRPKGGAHQ